MVLNSIWPPYILLLLILWVNTPCTIIIEYYRVNFYALYWLSYRKDIWLNRKDIWLKWCLFQDGCNIHVIYCFLMLWFCSACAKIMHIWRVWNAYVFNWWRNNIKHEYENIIIMFNSKWLPYSCCVMNQKYEICIPEIALDSRWPI